MTTLPLTGLRPERAVENLVVKGISHEETPAGPTSQDVRASRVAKSLVIIKNFLGS